jgi:hypothetical protein
MLGSLYFLGWPFPWERPFFSVSDMKNFLREVANWTEVKYDRKSRDFLPCIWYAYGMVHNEPLSKVFTNGV